MIVLEHLRWIRSQRSELGFTRVALLVDVQGSALCIFQLCKRLYIEANLNILNIKCTNIMVLTLSIIKTCIINELL